MSIPRNLGAFADNVNTNGKVEVTGINATGTPSGSTVLFGNGTWGTAGSQWTTTGSDIYYTTGKVGIGTSSPVSTFQVEGSYTNTSDATIVASSNIPGINLRTASAGRFSILLGYSNNNVTSFMTGTGTNNPSTEVMVIDHSTTNIRFQSCISVGAATPSINGAGITFPATQSASTNANTLDDYEEGTWTPNVRSLANLTGTPSYYSTLYTKIGNKCFMEAGVNGLSVTTANVRTNFTVDFPFSAVSAFAVSGTAVSNNASGLGGFLGTNTAFSTIYWETGTIIPSGAQSFQIGAWISTA